MDEEDVCDDTSSEDLDGSAEKTCDESGSQKGAVATRACADCGPDRCYEDGD